MPRIKEVPLRTTTHIVTEAPPGARLNVTEGPSPRAIDPLDDLQGAIRKNGRFRIDNRMVHLTYSIHLNQQEFIEWIRSQVPVPLDMYSVVHETGGEGDHPHTHAALKFESAILTTDPSFFDYQGFHPHIRIINNKGHWDYVCGTYHLKEGGALFSNYSSGKKAITATELSKCPTKREVVRLLDSRGELEKMSKIMPAWEQVREEPIPISVITALRSWQQWITDFIDAELPDDRTVIWMVDEKGAAGKSSLSQQLYTKKKACLLTVTSKAADSIFALKTWMERNGSPKAIIIDVARSSPVRAVYQLLETLKSSTIMSSKYESGHLHLPQPPAVIVFSNTRPDVSKLTADRWCITYPDPMGLRIDYAFMGLSAQTAVRAVQYIAKRGGKRVSFNDGPRQELPISVYDPLSPFLSLKERERYWARGVFPIIILKGKPEGSSIAIEEHPLSQEEIANYRKSRSSHNLEEHAARLYAHAEDMVKRREEEGYYDD
jgi:hypothetical protein